MNTSIDSKINAMKVKYAVKKENIDADLRITRGINN